MHHFYSWLPVNISSIVDMYLFGHLTFEEIAKVKEQQKERIESIFDKVKKSFRKHFKSLSDTSNAVHVAA